ncbi:hypothetical protein BDK51DRAFT_32859 [Blyttiomyces helicus]|uniref:Uncharacterized protein n=1 Tax=Blyttiomyces helicus TaxID=388810 RepID=A0A4P9W0I1_9FUNG|nr:hypothetical protein BDK51DRAFT_32859 [Blyttiomyces helicus]|eukprot:RKO84613.1 hypothetical protein BDK51DRAFT_32859 [Blyttiomyces helicus]
MPSNLLLPDPSFYQSEPIASHCHASIFTVAGVESTPRDLRLPTVPKFAPRLPHRLLTNDCLVGTQGGQFQPVDESRVGPVGVCKFRACADGLAGIVHWIGMGLINLDVKRIVRFDPPTPPSPPLPELLAPYIRESLVGNEDEPDDEVPADYNEAYEIDLDLKATRRRQQCFWTVDNVAREQPCQFELRLLAFLITAGRKESDQSSSPIPPQSPPPSVAFNLRRTNFGGQSQSHPSSPLNVLPILAVDESTSL